MFMSSKVVVVGLDDAKPQPLTPNRPKLVTLVADYEGRRSSGGRIKTRFRPAIVLRNFLNLKWFGSWGTHSGARDALALIAAAVVFNPAVAKVVHRHPAPAAVERISGQAIWPRL